MRNGFLDTRTVDPAQVMAAFAEVIAQYQIKKAQTVGAPVGPYVHGPGGIFGVRGLERDVISTHTQITGSLGEMLPIQPSFDTNPLYPYITGFTRSDQQEKNAVCDNPAEVGTPKTCIQTTVFGRKEFKTRQVEINRIGQQRINRGEFLDLNVVNSPLVNQMAGLMQGFFGLQGQNAVLAGREMTMRFIEVGIGFQRWYCPQVYTGNPANSSAGGGYKEFPGLQLLIARNKVDALTGSACPSLYSDVKNFQYRQVSSTTNPDIVRTITTIYRILTRKAVQQNMAPVDIRLVMREPLFYEITRVWPCQYNTDGCSMPATAGAASIVLNQDAAEQIRFRDAMRNGSYLLIDGRQVPVILDDCIMEQESSDNGAIPVGCYSSDIYFVPFTARGGTLRTIYWDYLDYRNAVIPDATQARAAPTFFWSDNGVFLWGLKAPDNWCLEVICKTEPRIILRTPQLAGRLQNVTYCPIQHTDDPLPSQDYWTNGGVATGRPFPSPYSEWNGAGPGPGA